MQRAGVTPRIQRRVHALREVANRSAHELAFVPTETQERHGFGAVCELIAVLSGVPVPAALQAYCGMDEEALEEEQQTGGPVDVLRAVVLDAGQPSQGIGKSGRPMWYKAARCVLDEPDEGVETTLLLTGPWAQTPCGRTRLSARRHACAPQMGASARQGGVWSPFSRTSLWRRQRWLPALHALEKKGIHCALDIDPLNL